MPDLNLRNSLNIKLYAIIDPEHLYGHNILSLARDLAAGGATIIQYRAKNKPIREMIEEARALKAILPIPLLINDRVDVALASNADGVHLGQDDMSPLYARKLLGENAIIGITIKEQAHIENTPFFLIDYGCIGGVFATQSKNNPHIPLGLDGLTTLTHQWRLKTQKSVGAIAGITQANAGAVMACGVDGIAVISALSLGNVLTNTQNMMKAIS